MPKKIPGLLLMCVLAFVLRTPNGFAFSIVPPLSPAPQSTGRVIPDFMQGTRFVEMTPREFSLATGKRLNFFQRIYFKAIQHQVRRDLSSHPDMTISRYYDSKNERFKFDFLWLVIGAFIGPFGILAAYASKPRKGGSSRKARLFSVWIGFLLFFLWFGYIFIF